MVIARPGADTALHCFPEEMSDNLTVNTGRLAGQ